MPTENPRIQVTLDALVSRQLGALAKEERSSLSAVAAALIGEALELREDRALSQHADRRWKKKEKFLSHDEVWGDA